MAECDALNLGPIDLLLAKAYSCLRIVTIVKYARNLAPTTRMACA
jgi:hypothetical protein